MLSTNEWICSRLGGAWARCEAARRNISSLLNVETVLEGRAVRRISARSPMINDFRIFSVVVFIQLQCCVEHCTESIPSSGGATASESRVHGVYTWHSYDLDASK